MAAKKNNNKETENSVAKKENKKEPTTKKMVEKTLLQLRELTDLRKEEMDRQERFMEQMKDAARRQRTLFRVISGVAIAILIAGVILIYMVNSFSENQDTLSKDMNQALATQSNLTAEVGNEVATARDTFVDVAGEQSQQIEGVMSELATTRGQQAGLSRQIEETSKELIGTASAKIDDVTEAGKKQIAVAESLKDQMETTKRNIGEKVSESTEKVDNLQKEVATTRKTFDKIAGKQFKEIDAVQRELNVARKSQAGLMKSFQSQIEESHQRLREMQKGVEKALASIRKERDSIRKEVEKTLQEESREMSRREAELRAEMQDLKAEKEETQRTERELDRRRKILQKAMQELQMVAPPAGKDGESGKEDAEKKEK